MFSKLLNFMLFPFAIIGWLAARLVNLAKPAPVRQATARMDNAQSVKSLLDAEEAKEDTKEFDVPKWTKPGPAMLPPAAAMAHAGHLIYGEPDADLSYVLPEVAEWIRGMTRDEALAIRRMSRDQLEDHVYARRTSPYLRPVAHRDPRLMDDDQTDYLDDLLPAMR